LLVIAEIDVTSVKVVQSSRSGPSHVRRWTPKQTDTENGLQIEWQGPLTSPDKIGTFTNSTIVFRFALIT
jgi:hypothetical protein